MKENNKMLKLRNEAEFITETIEKGRETITTIQMKELDLQDEYNSLMNQYHQEGTKFFEYIERK